MPLGTFIVMYVDRTQGDIMERIDTTPLHRRIRFRKRVHGRRVKTRLWFDDTGAERIPQKSKIFEVIDLEYFQKTAPDLDTYQVTLRPWIDER